MRSLLSIGGPHLFCHTWAERITACGSACRNEQRIARGGSASGLSGYPVLHTGDSSEQVSVHEVLRLLPGNEGTFTRFQVDRDWEVSA